jgi:hypothetical protein
MVTFFLIFVPAEESQATHVTRKPSNRPPLVWGPPFVWGQGVRRSHELGVTDFRFNERRTP